MKTSGTQNHTLFTTSTLGGGERYWFGFNGMESEDELYGESNSYTTTWRQYDPRLGRWWSIDPKSYFFPDVSPYVFSLNNPIFLNDPDGDCPPGVDCGNVVANPRIASSGASGPSGGRFGKGVRSGGARDHWGTDIFAPKGTQIRVMIAGKIINQGFSSSWGYYVMIKSENPNKEGEYIFTVYAHLGDKFEKKLYDEVKKGEVIGVQGNSGNASDDVRTGEEHVHVEVREGSTWEQGEKKNPEEYMESTFDESGNESLSSKNNREFKRITSMSSSNQRGFMLTRTK